MTETNVVDQPKATEATEPAVEPKAKRVNPAWAPEEQRLALAAFLLDLNKNQGFTRPFITEHTGFNDSTVWRGINGKANIIEMDVWMKFAAAVRAGEIKPEAKSRKLDAKALTDQLQHAANVVAELIKTKGMQKAVKEQLEALAGSLPAPVQADEAETSDDAEQPAA